MACWSPEPCGHEGDGICPLCLRPAKGSQNVRAEDAFRLLALRLPGPKAWDEIPPDRCPEAWQRAGFPF